ncbi:MAG: UDP-3-O-(3-hydroxymyristoyl)glucosamine N-acyltransferase [Phyllobacteriaceae bacterium]|nr:UDP-3-O-(3-hydroxymyristoyl)glucosamine N-acyltransferase [Phyllobacteriaceae bacterium]
MAVVSFFRLELPLTLKAVCGLIGIDVPAGADANATIASVDAIGTAMPHDLTYAGSAKLKPQLEGLAQAWVICTPELAASVGHGSVALVHAAPAIAFNRVARALYPASVAAPDFAGCVAHASGAMVHPGAKMERGVVLGANCVIGDRVEIGANTVIGPGAAIAAGCTIGRNCQIGANAVLQCAILGDNVSIAPGASIGHDGFGFVPGPSGLEKVPQLGRVILQNAVEVGANTCIDRGALGDTVVGEGTKIDNMVQIAHNVRIGRNCAIAAHCGISGSVTIGDGTMLGGRAGIADHLTVGSGVMLAAASGVMTDVPDGARWGGAPAKPLRELFREVATLKALATRQTKQ